MLNISFFQSLAQEKPDKTYSQQEIIYHLEVLP